MKKSHNILFLFVSLGILSFISRQQGTPSIFLIDASKSKIAWKSTLEDGKNHNGELKFKSGNVQFDVKTLTSGFMYIDMQSITCLDIKDTGFNKELMTQMRSESQLNLLKFKEATFKILKAKRLDVAEGQPNYDIEGNLKLKGLDIPVKTIATLKVDKKLVSGKAKFKVEKAVSKLPYDLDFDLTIAANIKE